MVSIESPAKLNLSLLVSPPRTDGYHPIHSIAQTIDWCDELRVEPSEEGRDTLEIEGADLDPEDNLVIKTLHGVRQVAEVPPLMMSLSKRIPMEAGLGGGSSNAAAILEFVADRGWLEREQMASVASSVGADVSLFLSGGTVEMSGIGDSIEAMRPLAGFAFAVVVPEFGLSSAEVYRRWDEMEGPEGEVVPDHHLPPGLRDSMPMRNDLLPAAIDLEPQLAELMAEMRQRWDTAVCLTGSGSACFGYFASVDEAADAARSVSDLVRLGRGVALRGHGVAVDG